MPAAVSTSASAAFTCAAEQPAPVQRARITAAQSDKPDDASDGVDDARSGHRIVPKGARCETNHLRGVVHMQVSTIGPKSARIAWAIISWGGTYQPPAL